MQAFTGGPGGLDPQALFQANFNGWLHAGTNRAQPAAHN